MRNLPKMFAAGALTLFLATLIVLLSIVWGEAATVRQNFYIGATDYDSLRYYVISSGVAVPSAMRRTGPTPITTAYFALDNTVQNQLRVDYYFNNQRITEDVPINTRQAVSAISLNRVLYSVGADTCRLEVWSGLDSLQLASVDTAVIFPDTVTRTLSASQMHQVREIWHFTGESNGEYTIETWYPITNDTTITVAGTGDTVYAGLPPPTDSNKCRVWGYLYNAQSEGVAYQPVTFTPPSKRNTCSDALILDGVTPITVETTPAGQFYADLLWSSCLDSGLYIIQYGPGENQKRSFFVPDDTLYQLTPADFYD